MSHLEKEKASEKRGNQFSFSPLVSWTLLSTALVCGLLFLIGLKIMPERAWGNFLIDNLFFVFIALAAGVFICIHNLAQGGWLTLIRRIPEAMIAYLPVGFLMMVLFYPGIHHLYHWSHASVVASDPILQSKAIYLNVPFFLIRMILFFILWIGLTGLFVRHSRQQDFDGDTKHTLLNRKYSAIFLVVFCLSFTLASVDWLMSLEPHWYSTLFPWYAASGLFISGISMLTLLYIILRSLGYLPQANVAHLHDLGKYVLAFSIFWGYLWYSQYMLIWYTNIPEETIRYFVRSQGHWACLFWLNPILNLGLPLLLLISSTLKRRSGWMATICVLLLAGHWLDFYLMIMPSVMRHGPRLGWIEIITFLGFASLFFYVVLRKLSHYSLLPEKDPYLNESIHFHG